MKDRIAVLHLLFDKSSLDEISKVQYYAKFSIGDTPLKRKETLDQIYKYMITEFPSYVTPKKKSSFNLKKV